jgi:hypothetical protein
MFGVNSAAHAASRSAKTSPGAARNNATTSVSSALDRRNPRIPNSPDHFFTQSVFSKHPDELGLVCVKTRAEQEPELGIFGAAGIRKFAQVCGIRCEVFTRDGKDVPTSYDAVRAWKPTATVELHFNAVENPAERPDLKGSLVLFGAEDSRRWAQTLQDMMVALYNRQGPRENRHPSWPESI